MLRNLGWLAYKAHEYVKAQNYARVILRDQSMDQYGRPLVSAEMVHHAYLVLGSVALGRGDKKAAVENLVDSVVVPNPKEYDEITPDMSLARQILDAGDKEAVLKFLEMSFEMCRDYKNERQKRLDRIAAIKNNQPLILERFIDYRD